MSKPPATRADKDPDVLAFGVLLESYRSIERTLTSDLQRRAGMSHVWFDALIRIAEKPDKAVTMGELCAETSLTSGGATRLIDRLVEAGYVERRSSAKDRRVQLAALTAEGAQALDDAAVIHGENIRLHFTGKLSEQELGQFLAMLRKIRVPSAVT